MSIVDFINESCHNKSFMVMTSLTFVVILVNGWTDAPNAIATCISTRSMKPRAAIYMAAIFNFLGVFVMALLNTTVAETIYNMVDFHGNSQQAMVALCAALVGIVIWATVAWWFGIPTSESHALIAGISGAAIALQSGMEGIHGSEWIKVIYGLLLSMSMGFLLGWIVVTLVGTAFRACDRRKTYKVFQRAQITAGAGMAFMHGAQDGQKFMGVFMLGMFLTQGDSQTLSFQIPIWLMILCSCIMVLGTSIGGYRIIKSVGMDMVKLETYQGFAADFAAVICLLVASIFGLPVSTTHTKTTAIMGVGAAKKLSSVNWGIVRNMMLAWILTFPGCGLVGYVMAKVFMEFFGTK